MGLDITGLGSVADLANSVVNKLWPDKTQEEKDQLAAALTLAQGQMTTNNTEAANKSTFVSGWRPFIGWVCGAAVAWNWIGIPLAKIILPLFHQNFAIAPADISQMFPVLMGMLGLGRLRTVEKINGVAAK